MNESASQTPNPYAPGVVTQKDWGGRSVQLVRKNHLTHEASIKSVGLICFVASGICVLICGSNIATANSFTANGSQAGKTFFMMVGVIAGMLAPCYFITAFGLRKLAPWSKLPGTILSAIGLLGFPFLTFLFGIALYYLVTPKATMVFSDEYKEIIRQTSSMKYKTPGGILVFTFFLFLLLAVLLARVFLP